MDDKLTEVSNSVTKILGHDRPGMVQSYTDLIALWEKLHRDGVCSFDFCLSAIEVADAIMCYYESIDDSTSFAKAMKERAQITIRSTSQHWPPVDPAKWPDGWRSK